MAEWTYPDPEHVAEKMHLTPKHVLPQDERDIDERVGHDTDVRVGMRPRTPPAPAITFAVISPPKVTIGASSVSITAVQATLTWSNARKDMDYIARWKQNSETNYTYVRLKTSPATIFNVPSGAVLNFALSQEWRANGARSGFTTDVNATST